jgi:cytoskeleton protein RodZ
MVEEQPGQSAAPGLPTLSVGALLADARAASGRELTDIARETRVPLRHLMAIEADDHDALPALPYALGFVKAFARAVGLDAEAIGARFRAETRLAPHVPTPSSLEPVDEARLPSRGLAFGALAALAVVLGGLGVYGSGAFDPEPSPGSAAVAITDDAVPAPVASPAIPAAAAAPAVPAAPAAIPTSGPVMLTAREDVWVKIYDRTTGRRAFMGVLFAGKSWTAPDDSALTLRAGRAGVIEVRVAGVLLPPLGGSVDTIDGVMLTAAAMAARFGSVQPPVIPDPALAPMPAAPAGNRTGG